MLRDRPYLQFSFLVDFGTGSTEGPEAGFADVSGIGMEPTQCAPHNRRENRVTKIIGISTFTDVTLRHGGMSSRSLYNLPDQTRDGGPVNLNDTHVAVEELVFACERLEME